MTVMSPESIRDQQRATWDSVSVGWRDWQEQLEQGAGPVTARLLDIGGVAPGHQVLDIGSGTGEPALSAARRVGAAGKVIGVDLSPSMIDAARLAARGLDNVAFVLGDLETTILPSQSFDAALSRWSLMFAADRVELLRVAARLLKPGGALSAAVWGRPEEVPLISLAFRVISTYLALPPPPPGPGPFSMADPGTVTTELAQGGFTDIEIRPDVVTFDFRSVDDFARFSRDVLPPGMKRLLQEQCTGVDDAALWERFSMAASAYQSPDGHVVLPCSCTFVRAIARGGA